jgi:hypothetical protein
MKRIITLLLLAFPLGFLFAQAAELEEEEGLTLEAGAAESSGEAAKKPLHWWEWFHGISVGVESGAHEYPLAVWYPSQKDIEGYSIRSFYITPTIAYQRLFGDVDVAAKIDTIIDLGAPDPAPGVLALNAKDADRKDWYTIYMEEKVDWAVSNLFGEEVDFPGTLSVFFVNENNFYAYPKFPAIPGRPEGKVADGRMELGPGRFHMNTKGGWFLGQISVPLYYLYRFNNDIGSGLNMRFGYKAPFNLGLELVSRSLFIPRVEQVETEFVVSYEWLDFSAELDIIAYGAFKTAMINPEVQYHLESFTFTFGVKISDIGRKAAYSPYLGLAWKY